MTIKRQVALKEIPPPNEVVGSMEAQEVLRCWIKDGSLLVSVLPIVFEGSAETWGLLLSDVARHVAQSLEQENIDTYESARNRIREQFDIEWEKPTGVAKTTDAKKQ